MYTMLSVENSRRWSWSLVLLELIEKLQDDYKVVRILKNFTAGALNELVNYFDLTLVQNVDSIALFTGNKQRIISRMGGVRTFNLSRTPFDNDLKQVGAIIATNDELYKVGCRNNSNTFLIPNGVDLSLFKPRPERQQPYNDNDDKKLFVVGFAGNIIGKMCMDYKGWDYLTQATLRLYGQIELKTLLFHHSQIPHKQMPSEFYHQIDCLVLPSLGEGCSNVITEALACGVPVLLTKVGYHGERLDDGVNCLFIKRSIDSIINAIVSLKHSTELRMKLAFEGRLFAEINHDINKMALEYKKVFEQILQKANRKE